MQTNVHETMSDKRKTRSLIRFFYALQRWAFRLLVCSIVLLFVLLLIGLIIFKTVWGAWLLSFALPWQWLFPGALVLGFLFIFTDTLLQSQEERWFSRYGTQVMATVTSIKEVRTMRWRRWLFLNMTEYILQVTWTHPQTEKIYVYERRVRNMRLPVQGSQVPVVIDYEDPAYFLRADFKRPY